MVCSGGMGLQTSSECTCVTFAIFNDILSGVLVIAGTTDDAIVVGVNDGEPGFSGSTASLLFCCVLFVHNFLSQVHS